MSEFDEKISGYDQILADNVPMPKRGSLKFDTASFTVVNDRVKKCITVNRKAGGGDEPPKEFYFHLSDSGRVANVMSTPIDGDSTTGIAFYCYEAGRVCKGIKFAYRTVADRTVRAKIWQGTTLQRTVDVPVLAGTNVYEGLFADLTIAKNTIYTIGIRALDGVAYSNAYGNDGQVRRHVPSSPLFMGRSVVITDCRLRNAGDVQPTTTDNSYLYYLIDPIIAE